MARVEDVVSQVRRRLLIGEAAVSGIEGFLKAIIGKRAQTESDRRLQELWLKRFGLEQVGKEDILRLRTSLEKVLIEERGRQARLTLEKRGEFPATGARRPEKLQNIKIKSFDDFTSDEVIKFNKTLRLGETPITATTFDQLSRVNSKLAANVFEKYISQLDTELLNKGTPFNVDGVTRFFVKNQVGLEKILSDVSRSLVRNKGVTDVLQNERPQSFLNKLSFISQNADPNTRKLFSRRQVLGETVSAIQTVLGGQRVTQVIGQPLEERPLGFFGKITKGIKEFVERTAGEIPAKPISSQERQVFSEFISGGGTESDIRQFKAVKEQATKSGMDLSTFLIAQQRQGIFSPEEAQLISKINLAERTGKVGLTKFLKTEIIAEVGRTGKDIITISQESLNKILENLNIQKNLIDPFVLKQPEQPQEVF